MTLCRSQRAEDKEALLKVPVWDIVRLVNLTDYSMNENSFSIRPKRERPGSSAFSAKKQCAGEKKRGSRAPQQIDGMPVRRLYGRWSRAGRIKALGATLTPSAGRESHEEGSREQSMAHHCPNSSSAKSRSHSTPIACQYQTVASTRIWRVSIRRERCSPASAVTSAPTPISRCAAWA